MKTEEKSTGKIVVIIEYNKEQIVQKEVLESLRESRSSQYKIIDYMSLLPSEGDKNQKALYAIEAFCNWLIRECRLRNDSPFHIDEYLYAMVSEWHNRK